MKKPQTFKFRLCVAGDSPNSAQARANLERICRECLVDCHLIEVIDVLSRPERALKDKVMITPTLFKLEPKPTRTIIGNLGNSSVMRRSLGLQPI